MRNGIFKLDFGSIADAALTGLVVAAAVAFYGVVTTAGFNVFTADWATIGSNMLNLGFIGAVVSIGQDLLSTNAGSLLNVTPDVNPSSI